ncbi:hypothetical protein RND81_04G188400 [Saponaria officinalis]|uniref:Sodium/metabolite cotransporter BASS4, chloroplastic n=1 Tax=Saponaria officinalis TaxID=3572 RepID=A0AAW1LMJ7_SAPOF
MLSRMSTTTPVVDVYSFANIDRIVHYSRLLHLLLISTPYIFLKITSKMAGITKALNFTISPTSSSLASSIYFKTLIPNSHFPTIKNPFISINNPSIIHPKPGFIVSPIIASASSDYVGDEGNSDFEGNKSGNVSKFAKPILDFTSNNFLPLALVGGVALGLANPSLGCLADKYSLSKLSTFCIFIISGLTLRSQEIGAAADAWPVGLFGLASILFLTPVFSMFILQLNFQPQEFVTGLAIFACMPTSLSSGVSLTQLAGGNFALALAMTVISNLLGILIVPFTVSKFVAAGVGISIPTKHLLKSLVMTLLIPLILGKVIREVVDGE